MTPDLVHDDEGRPSLLGLWIPGYPPTYNSVVKATHHARGGIRRKYQAQVADALDVALADVPAIDDDVLAAWAKAKRNDRIEAADVLLEMFEPRLFAGMVRVDATPHYPSAKWVPDTGGITPAVKWAMDKVTRSGCLMGDTRHDVLSELHHAPRIDRSLDDACLLLVIEAV